MTLSPVSPSAPKLVAEPAPRQPTAPAAAGTYSRGLSRTPTGLLAISDVICAAIWHLRRHVMVVPLPWAEPLAARAGLDIASGRG